MTHKLGNNQISVLEALKEKTRYYPGCGWSWDSTSSTIRILDSLVKRGLAKRLDAQGRKFSTYHYTITEAGRTAIAKAEGR